MLLVKLAINVDTVTDIRNETSDIITLLSVEDNKAFGEKTHQIG